MRILSRWFAPALLVWSVSGCLMGMSSEKFTPANSPAGAELRLRTRAGDMAGELLEVRDSGVVVAPRGDIMFIPYSAIRSAVVVQTPVRFNGTPGEGVRERLRLLSRYPAGIPVEALARLLAMRGQQALRVYQP